MKTYLRQYMDETGLTYRAAAHKTGLTGQTVYLHASGQQGMSGRAAFAYRQAFGLDLEKLLTNRGLNGAED